MKCELRKKNLINSYALSLLFHLILRENIQQHHYTQKKSIISIAAVNKSPNIKSLSKHRTVLKADKQKIRKTLFFVRNPSHNHKQCTLILCVSLFFCGVFYWRYFSAFLVATCIFLIPCVFFVWVFAMGNIN